MEPTTDLLLVCASLEDYAPLAWRTASPNFNLYGSQTEGSAALDALRVSYASSINFVDALHAGLGLSGELRELREGVVRGDAVNVLEELGDAYWYAALIYRYVGQSAVGTAQLGITFSPMLTSLAPLDMDAAQLFEALETEAHSYQDVIKGIVFYGKSPDWPSQVQQLRRLVDGLDRLSRAFGSIPARTRAANLQKLRCRYPDVYSDLDSQRRDLTAELNQLTADLTVTIALA